MRPVAFVPPFVEFVYTLLLVAFPFVTPILGILWVWAWVTAGASDRGTRRIPWLGLSLPFAVPAAIVLVGFVFAARPPYNAATGSYAVYILDILLIAEFALVLLLLWRCREHRLGVLASSLFGGDLSLVAWFYSVMSVTGNWL